MLKLWEGIQVMLVQSKGELCAETYLERIRNGENITHNQIADEFGITAGVLRYYLNKRNKK